MIRKMHKAARRRPTRSAACFEATIDGKHGRRRVRARPDLRDTEQVPLLEEGGVEAFLEREVLPYAPDAWYDPASDQDRLRDQLHPRVLQAAAAALAGGDPRGHPRAGARDGGLARRDRRRRGRRDRRAEALSGVRRSSGVPWLGEVPAALEAVPQAGSCCDVEGARQRRGMTSTELLSLTTQRRDRQRHGCSTGSCSSGALDTTRSVRVGDLVIRLFDGPRDAMGSRPVAASDGMITWRYTVFESSGPVHPRVLRLCFVSRDGTTRNRSARCTRGSRKSRSPIRTILRYQARRCLRPSEQAAIVRFLDHADRRIRRAIRAKQKLIALLNEQKQAVIHRAVTRGLDPNVRLEAVGRRLARRRARALGGHAAQAASCRRVDARSTSSRPMSDRSLSTRVAHVSRCAMLGSATERRPSGRPQASRPSTDDGLGTGDVMFERAEHRGW